MRSEFRAVAPRLSPRPTREESATIQAQNSPIQALCVSGDLVIE